MFVAEKNIKAIVAYARCKLMIFVEYCNRWICNSRARRARVGKGSKITVLRDSDCEAIRVEEITF